MSPLPMTGIETATFHFGNDSVVGSAAIELCACATVNSDSRRPCVLGHLGEIDSVDAVIVPALAKLDGDRYF